MRLDFRKMHGAGNDFVVLDTRARPPVTPQEARFLADRRTGVGCDQVIGLETGQGADIFMRIRNPDGSEAGACGNATRCVAELLREQTGRESLTVRTISGVLPATYRGHGEWSVDMGAPRLAWDEIPLSHEADTLAAPLEIEDLRFPACASMGNPHATFFVDDIASVDIPRLGPILEHAPLFPERANIGFAQILAPDRIRLRVWERGAGLTLACGSGACATLVNAARRGLTGRAATLLLDGGELHIAWRDDNGPAAGHVVMTGPTATAFTGSVDLP